MAHGKHNPVAPSCSYNSTASIPSRRINQLAGTSIDATPSLPKARACWYFEQTNHGLVYRSCVVDACTTGAYAERPAVNDVTHQFPRIRSNGIFNVFPFFNACLNRMR